MLLDCLSIPSTTPEGMYALCISDDTSIPCRVQKPLFIDQPLRPPQPEGAPCAADTTTAEAKETDKNDRDLKEGVEYMEAALTRNPSDVGEMVQLIRPLPPNKKLLIRIEPLE